MTNVQALKKLPEPLDANANTVDAPAQVLATILMRLHDDDLEGARTALKNYCNGRAWRKADTGDIVSVAVLLLDELAEVMTKKAPMGIRQPFQEFRTQQDEYSFTCSSHLSLLTASVIRQRSQIAALLDLIGKLSRRFS